MIFIKKKAANWQLFIRAIVYLSAEFPFWGINYVAI